MKNRREYRKLKRLKKIHREAGELYKKKIEVMDLGLYKLFGYPRLKEMTIDDKDFPETWADIYKIKIADLKLVDLPHMESWRRNPRKKGRGFVLFSEDDMRKLPKIGLRSVELIISKDNELLVIMHR